MASEKRSLSKRKNTWYPLDNAAKIYPPTASDKRAHVFCFSAILTEEVDPYSLREAVVILLEKYPTFKTKLMRGKFWYYLENNDLPFKVFKEDAYYLKSIDHQQNNGYLFEVLYIRNKITVKFFHALTDGTGGFNFFKSLILTYFSVIGKDVDAEGLLKPIDAPSTASEGEDSFLTYHNVTGDKTEKISKPYHIRAKPFDYDGCGMITAKVPISDVKELANAANVTITAYLSALYSYCVYKAFLADRPEKNKLVTVLIPCNLRKKYGGETQRNFTMFARFSHDYTVYDTTVEQLAVECQNKMNDDLRVEKLDKIIDDNVKLERNFFIKIAPLILKDVIMRTAYAKVGEVLQTVNFSNLGLVKFPESVSPFVKEVTFSITPTFSCNHQTGVIGYGDYLYVTFARGYVETELEKTFIRFLTAKGLKIEVSSNFWESQP